MKIQRVKYKDIEQIPYLKIKQNFKQDFSGTAPAPFIGRFGYPNINIGILSPQFSGDLTEYDSPKLWSQQNSPIGKIASLRYDLVNSRTKGNIKDVHASNKFLNIAQESAMAKKGVDVEINLKKLPQLLSNPEKEIIPFGPQAEIIKARITSNPSVDTRIEKVVFDTDLKASLALLSLYQKGFEENTLTKLLSVGNLGLKQNRKLVPTRWSITAVNDTVGKKLIQEIKQFPQGSNYFLHFGGGWGNYYLLLFFPEVWSYELFETYIAYKINPWSKAGLFYSTDYENYSGRKEYAEETAGGYYACRIGIAEKMKELKRQYSCLALRFITSEYNIPLGVWVCREATRKSLSQPKINFNTEKELLNYAETLIKAKFNFEISELLNQSLLVRNKKQQKRLAEFSS